MSQRLRDPKAPLEQIGRSWMALLALGALTMILGIVVLAEPGSSIVVIAILVGIDFLMAGLFRLTRAVVGAARERGLTAIVGIILILVGLFLIRHLGITLLLMAALVGIFWIASGISEIANSAGGQAGPHRIWSLALGVISIIAGIVALAYPVGSLLALALVVGITLLIRGITQILMALRIRKHFDQIPDDVL